MHNDAFTYFIFLYSALSYGYREPFQLKPLHRCENFRKAPPLFASYLNVPNFSFFSHLFCTAGFHLSHGYQMLNWPLSGENTPALHHLINEALVNSFLITLFPLRALISDLLSCSNLPLVQKQ